MTSNEQRLIRRFQEQTARCGGWLRIFPCPATWAQYAPLLYGNSRPEMSESPQLHWWYSTSTPPASTPTDVNPTATSRSKHRASGSFSANVSATKAVSAMQKVSTLTIELMVEEEDKEITLVHPNLIPPKTNVGMFTGLSKPGEWDLAPCAGIEDHNAELVVNVPALQASDANILLPIHSLSKSSLSECLMVALGFSLHVSCTKREQANRVFSCYNQTLGRLPFYHRKIGTLPTCIRGVCLLAGCGHNSERQTLCGMRMFYATKSNHKRAPEPSYESVQVQTNASDRGYKIDMCDQEKQEITVTSITQYQARLIFSAYLTRIHSRINEQLDGDETTKSSDCKREDREINLILRFLQKAALKLSPHSVNWFHRSHSGQLVPPRPLKHESIFQISDFPANTKLITKQRMLLSLLDKFIQIYEHETASLFITRGNCENDCTTGADFQRFLEGATEKELEDILNQYARTYHSLSLFAQPSVEIPKFRSKTDMLGAVHGRAKITPMRVSELGRCDSIGSPVPHSKNSKNLQKKVRTKITRTERRARSVNFSSSVESKEASSLEFSQWKYSDEEDHCEMMKSNASRRCDEGGIKSDANFGDFCKRDKICNKDGVHFGDVDVYDINSQKENHLCF